MIEWFHEGIPVLGPHGDDHRIVLPDGSLFFLRALRGIDDGNYWCVASNLNFQQQPQPPSPRQLSLDASNRVARSRNATLRVACKKLPTIFHVPWDANRGAFSKVSKNKRESKRWCIHIKFPRMWQEHFFIFTLSSKERGIAWQLDIIIIIFCLPSCCFSLEYANHEEELAFWRMLQDITKICWLQSWPTNLIFWRMQMKEKSRQKTLLFSNFLRCDLQNSIFLELLF